MEPKWIKFNDTVIQNPDLGSWSEDFEVIDKQYETEAGTTLVSVTRYGKLSASGTWTVSETRKREFETWARSGAVSVQIAHDLDIGGNPNTRTCILRDLKAKLVGHSGGIAYFNMSMKIQEL